MCPACLASVALTAAGATATGGLGLLAIVRTLRAFTKPAAPEES